MPTIAELTLAMERAAAALDFETASRLRDQLSLLRLAGQGDATVLANPAGLTRQQPGAMGLGTSQQSTVPPEGWVKPAKPDPLTAGRNRRARRR